MYNLCNVTFQCLIHEVFKRSNYVFIICNVATYHQCEVIWTDSAVFKSLKLREAKAYPYPNLS